ncbi:ATP-binding protein [Archangium gephyra]|uniref:HD domain-containing protein n=1 Tax=Archangium gephyra TaxID=48 RepID=UPI0035D42908
MPDIIEIPPALAQILARDPGLHGAILITLRNFHPWLRTSGMPFFPGFTDHSDKHISEVLATASSLIADDARGIISPADVAILILSAILHDAGMHLTPDGFRNLVEPAAKHPRIEGFGDLPWQRLWTDFLSEASRFDSRKLVSIFGDTRPVEPRKVDIHNLGEREHLLVGEFIRRHHARLAHEMARWGVPGPGKERLRLEGISPELADLAGLVARSHGLPLRATYDYLKSNYHPRDFQGVHAVFLMAVLRISDYLQVQSERADKALLRVKQLRSPVSQREWRAHEAIRDVQTSHEDPEALYVDALPADIGTYAKLSWLLKDIQSELDKSWASIGEVYGRYPPLNRLGLTIRRLHSTLDDTAEFSKKVNYIPAPVRFDVAGMDLLRLLVGPLYGNRRSVGIRELIQNSTDACRERVDWERHHRIQRPTSKDSEADVVIDFEESPDEKERWITIRDSGIGMTREVIQNYFLRAGASFRSSDAWRREHEDEQGRSRVLRGGRFGVGALAAFLLCDRLEVTTRHVSEPPERAITFKAALDSETLELRYTTAPVGTTIRIPVTDPAVWSELGVPGYLEEEPDGRPSKISNWSGVDWYFIASPSVSIRYKKEGRVGVFEPEHVLPGAGAELPTGWYRIAHPDYADIQWTYQDAPAVVCNGIVVQREYTGHSELDSLWFFPGFTSTETVKTSYIRFDRPRLSVFDAQGVLPLDLQRTSITGTSLSFDEQLIESISRDFLAFVLVRLGDKRPGDEGFAGDLASIGSYPGLYFNGTRTPFVFKKSGFTFLDRGPLLGLGVKRLWCFPSPSDCSPEVFSLLPDDTAIFFLDQRTFSFSDSNWFRQSLSRWERGGRSSTCSALAYLWMAYHRTVLDKKAFRSIKKPGVVRKSLIEKTKVEASFGEFVVLTAETAKNRPVPDLDAFLEVARIQSTSAMPYMAEWTLFQNFWPGQLESPISKAWLEVFGQSLVPYDWKTRRRALAPAYKALETHLEHQKQLLELEKQRRKKKQQQEEDEDE